MINAFRNLIASKFHFLQKPITFLICVPIFFLLIGLFLHRFQPVDPDLWWHLNVGRDISQSGIQFKDIYSYTLPGYEWVDHEWLLNYFLYLGFCLTNNFIFLASFFGLITFFCLYSLSSLEFSFSSKNQKSHLQQLEKLESQIAIWSGVLIAFLACYSVIGLRAQAVSLMFLSFLICLTNKQNWHKKKKIFWVLPIIFLLWANMHAGFVVGLVFLAIDLLITFFQKKSYADEFTGVIKNKLFLFSLVLLASLINPYGGKIYSEIFNVFTDSYAHQWIQEWRAPNLVKAKFFPFVFYFVTYLFFFFYRRVALKEKIHLNSAFICSFVFLLFSFRSSRHITLFVFFSLPFYSESIQIILSKIMLRLAIKGVSEESTLSLGRFLFLLLSIFLFFISYSFLASQIPKFIAATTNPKTINKDYPLKALTFLKKQPQHSFHNILAEYSWGGFISWTSPKMKIFIDGRMPSWKARKQIASSKTILEEFNFVICGDTEAKAVLEKYKIHYLLYSKARKNLWVPADWIKLYEDEQSIIYAKEKDGIEH